jgi:hypothetical protein
MVRSTNACFGEVEGPITFGGEDVVVRLAMDASLLPRERGIYPCANVVSAWAVARHVIFESPPAIVVACADVDFKWLTAPRVAPGELVLGPTFYGFRFCAAAPST